jgi:uncharacterized protein YkwD
MAFTLLPNTLGSLSTAAKVPACTLRRFVPDATAALPGSALSNKDAGGRSQSRRASARVALTLAGLMLYSLGAGPSVWAAIDCAQIITQYADVIPITSPPALQGAGQATLCLINQQRTHNVPPLPELAWSDQLEQAAQAHSADWVTSKLDPDRACPADPNPGWTWGSCTHQGSGGSWPEDRIPKSGYCTTGVNCGALSETTYNGWGMPGATPRKAVDWWMSDPPHKATLLDARFTDAGPGVAFGMWDGTPNGATYTVDFGARTGTRY